MDIIQQHGTLFLGLAVIFGLYMTWGIGANDVANVMGTSVGSGAITVTTAIIIAAIFECAGALIAGGDVAKDIRWRGCLRCFLAARVDTVLRQKRRRARL